MKKFTLILAVIAIMACLFGCGKKSDTPTAKIPGLSGGDVATVDGLSISKDDYQTYLHTNFGDKALMALCQEKIVEAWAKEENVYPTKEQIDKEIQKLKDEGQYEDALEQLGEKGLDTLILDQLLRTNISKKLTPPTEEEIKAAYDNFKDEYVHGPRKQTLVILSQEKASLDAISKEIANISSPEKIEKKVKELSKDYKDEKSVRTGTLWIADDTAGAPEEIIKAVKELEVGKLSKVSEIKGGGTPSIYFIVCVKKAEEASEKKLDEVKDDVADKVALMNSMTKAEFRDALQKRTENAKIEIKIEKFKDLADMITSPAPAMPAGAIPAEPAPAPKPEAKKK